MHAQHDIYADWVMTFLLYKKHTTVFSIVLAGIKNPVRMEQILPFKKSLHFEKGAQLTRFTSNFSNLPLICITISAFWLRY